MTNIIGPGANREGHDYHTVGNITIGGNRPNPRRFRKRFLSHFMLALGILTLLVVLQSQHKSRHEKGYAPVRSGQVDEVAVDHETNNNLAHSDMLDTFTGSTTEYVSSHPGSSTELQPEDELRVAVSPHSSSSSSSSSSSPSSSQYLQIVELELDRLQSQLDVSQALIESQNRLLEQQSAQLEEQQRQLAKGQDQILQLQQQIELQQIEQHQLQQDLQPLNNPASALSSLSDSQDIDLLEDPGVEVDGSVVTPLEEVDGERAQEPTDPRSLVPADVPKVPQVIQTDGSQTAIPEMAQTETLSDMELEEVEKDFVMDELTL